MASAPRFRSRKVVLVSPSSVTCWSASARSWRSAISSSIETIVACGVSGFGSLYTRRSISGMTRFSMAGMWTFIIQSSQSIDSGDQASLRLSSSDARAYAARVFEQSKGPLSRELKGSKSLWISAIFAERFAALSSALATGAREGAALRIRAAIPRAALAMAGGPTSANRALSDEARLESRRQRRPERIAGSPALKVLPLVHADHLAKALGGARVHVARAELVDGRRGPLDELRQREDHSRDDHVGRDEVERARACARICTCPFIIR